MKNQSNTVRPSTYIIMSYKQQCKQEGIILTRIKIIRAVLSGMPQQEVSIHWQCNKNTVCASMRLYKTLSQGQKELLQQSLTTSDLTEFSELEHSSRLPHSHSHALSTAQEAVVLNIHKNIRRS